ncbi:MAG: hypothetical protein ABIH42_09050 [Planctomycetota bacterium]
MFCFGRRGLIIVSICIAVTFAALSITFGKTNEEIYQEKLSQLSPDDVNGQYDLGVWCEQNHLSEQAKFHFEKVIQLNPDYAKARAKLGYVKYKNKWVKPEEKVKVDYDEKVTSLKDDDAKGHYDFGMWCKRKGLLEEAKLEFEKVLKIEPQNKKAIKQLESINKKVEGKSKGKKIESKLKPKESTEAALKGLKFLAEKGWDTTYQPAGQCALAAFAGLALLSSGSEEYNGAINKAADKVIADLNSFCTGKRPPPGNKQDNWALGIGGMFLAELY